MVNPVVAESLRWNVRDIEVMPDDGGWKRYEIIDGELFVTRAPHFRHQSVGGKIHTQLEVWSDQSGLGEAILGPGVIFTDEDAVIPDVIWMSNDRIAMLADEAGHFTGAPELAVEVLSAGVTNERRDRDAKLKLYSRQGVQEYWIADWRLKTLEIYRRENAQLKLQMTLLVTDMLTSPLLPGFSCSVDRLF